MTDHDSGDEHAAPTGDPAPEPAAVWFRLSARTTANALACRLGGPVYLCGSALSVWRPADYDVRVVLAEHDMARLFGRERLQGGDVFDWSERDLRRGREQLKQSRRLSRRFRCNVDFQIQTEAEHAAHEGRPRLRLDTVPDDVLAAGMGDA